MALITSFSQLYQRYPATIAKSIDLTLQLNSADGSKYMRGYPDPALVPYYPLMSYADPMLALMKMGENPPLLGSIVGMGQEIPQDRGNVQLTLEQFGSLKIGRSRALTEEDMAKLIEAEKFGLMNQAAAQQYILDAYLQSPALLTQGVINLGTRMAHEILAVGKCVYTDPVTQLSGRALDYTASVPAGNFKTALAGNARWNQPTTATPIADMAAHLNSYYANLQTFPEAIGMPSAVADAMLNAASTKQAVARLQGRISDSSTPDAGVLAGLPKPSLQEVKDALAMELTAAAQSSGRVPELIVTDAIYFYRDANGIIQNAPFVPAGYYFFLNQGILERAFIPTVAQRMGVTGASATNTAYNVVVETKSVEPPIENLIVASLFLPLCSDARYLGSCNVFGTPIS